MPRPHLRLALAAGLAAAAALAVVSSVPLRFEPGQPGWPRLVRGAAGGGAVHGVALLTLPGLDRSRPALLVVEAEDADGGPATLAVAVDDGPAQWLRASVAAPAVVPLPPARQPGARVALRREAGGGLPVLRSLQVQAERRAPLGPALLSFLLASGLAAALARRVGPGVALAIALVLGAALALASTTALVWLTLPAAGSLARLAAPAALLATAALVATRLGRDDRRRLTAGAALVTAFVFGAWVRAFFLPSAGSWDMEYWKAWTERAANHGLARVYGDPEPFSPSRFLARLRGQEPLWKIESRGRAFVVDYPPLAMALWRASWWMVGKVVPGLDGAEAQNVAVKLPPVLGDVAAVAVLVVAFRRLPGRALALAALYWAAPPSWLSSAVLGHLDGAYAPLMAAGLWAAGRGRGGWAGALFALAALIKPTALLAAPAAAIALAAARGALARALAAGLAVVAAALIPFALAGTAALAVAQVFRILFQRTLSGGFANLWWIVGHALASAGQGAAAWLGPVRVARLQDAPVPAAALGLFLFALASLLVLWRQRAVPGPRAAALAGAALVLAYGVLAVGVHENHPHAAVLLLVASGLATRGLRVLFAGVAIVSTLNMLVLSGLGRFYGPRHLVLEPFSRALGGLRLLPGFDLTLLLAAANLCLLAVLLRRLSADLRRAEGPA